MVHHYHAIIVLLHVGRQHRDGIKFLACWGKVWLYGRESNSEEKRINAGRDSLSLTTIEHCQLLRSVDPHMCAAYGHMWR